MRTWARLYIIYGVKKKSKFLICENIWTIALRFHIIFRCRYKRPSSRSIEVAGEMPKINNNAPLPELMDRKKRDIMERKGDKEDENKRQKQQKESSAAAL